MEENSSPQVVVKHKGVDLWPLFWIAAIIAMNGGWVSDQIVRFIKAAHGCN